MRFPGCLPLTFPVFSISLHSIPVNRPLPIDIYVEVGGRLTLIRRAGDAITPERVCGLNRHNLRQVYAPVEQRADYKEYLWSLAVNCPPDDKTRLLAVSESAHIQIEELHQATDIEPAIGDTVEFLKRLCGLSAGDSTLLPGLVALIDPDEKRGHQHAMDTCLYSMVLANHLSGGVDSNSMDAAVAGLVHDLGERGFDPKMMDNPDRMSPSDWQKFKQHPIESLKLLEPVGGISNEALLAFAQHHECLDGSGYPRGLSGSQISPLARILTVCDVFDSLVVSHTASTSFPLRDALNLMQSVRPERFDPAVLKVFTETIEAFAKNRR